MNDEKTNAKSFPDCEEKKTYNTNPDENMHGWLTKSSIKMEKDEGDILGHMINGIGNGLKAGFKIFTETIQIKQKKQYFAIKNGVLYWY